MGPNNLHFNKLSNDDDDDDEGDDSLEPDFKNNFFKPALLLGMVSGSTNLHSKLVSREI